MRKLPNPRVAGEITIKKVPKEIRTILNRISFFRERFFSLTSINLDTNMELNKSATNNDDPKTIDSVMGK